RPDTAAAGGMMWRMLGRRQIARLSRLGPSVMGERLGGFIYGTIVVLSVLVAGSRAYPDDAGRIAVLVVVTSTVFWLAHVYAHVVADSIRREKHISLADLRRMARREGAIVEATLPPVVALLLGAFGVLSTHAAVWLAFALGLAVLAIEGVVVARVERFGALGTMVMVAANLTLGLALVVLKLVVTH
ncbi:MAG TPA: hypothetical protein VFG57_01585, partial [Gaiella sp.]|nr:hypothetical protein [Gaiella sp.]